MPSSPKAPDTPDPNALAAAQTKLTQNAQQSGLINQENQYGGQSYTRTVDPTTGNPTYTLRSSLSAPQQTLLNNLQSYQTQAGSDANSMLNSASDRYKTAPDFSASASGLTGQMMKKYSDYLNPQFDYQTKQLDTQLRNQGLSPGSDAYKQQMMNMSDNQNRSMSGFLAQIEPQAYQQAVSNYTMPIDISQKLQGSAMPANLNSTFSNTNGSIAPSNLGNAYGVANQTAQTNAGINQGNNSGLASIIGGGAGLLMGGPAGMGAGASLGGGLANLFGGWGNSNSKGGG